MCPSSNSVDFIRRNHFNNNLRKLIKLNNTTDHLQQQSGRTVSLQHCVLRDMGG